MKKALDFIYKLIIIFTIVCFTIALIGGTFFYVNRSKDYLNPIVIIIGTILNLVLLSKLYNLLKKMTSKQKKIMRITLLIIEFILLFISTRIINSIPKVDLIHIYTGINSLLSTNTLLNSDYFSTYPNNRAILIVLYGLSKIPIDLNITLGLFASLCITIMTIFIYKTVYKLSNENKATLSLLTCILSPIFYLYVSYIYTDVLALPLISILAYLIIKNTKDKTSIINLLLIGIIAIIGYKIRAVSIFILMAYFMYLVFNQEFKKLVKHIIPIILSCIVTLSAYNIIENKVFGNTKPNEAYPITHWLMMGSNLDSLGYYRQYDYEYTKSFQAKSDKQQYNLLKIKERLSKQGIIGNTVLIISKIYNVWGRGDYSYQKYLDLVKDYNISYKYLVEDKNIVINYILQFSKISTLLLIIISLILLYKNNSKSILSIAIFLSICFYILWEVCPRYGLSFLPWIIILTSLCYDRVDECIAIYQKKKIFNYIILVITVLLFIIGLPKYTNLKTRNNIIAKDTVNKIKYITLDKNTTITQSVKLHDKFNKIKLKFKVSDINGTYKLELITNDKMVYQKYFDTSIINSKSYTTFILDKDYSKGNYIIKLSSIDNIPLDVTISYKECFDYYPNGTLKVNTVEETGDLMFEIINSKKRGVLTYKEYLSIAIITTLIEYLLLIKKSKIKRTF